MCSQNRSSGFFWLALLFGVLLFSARTTWGQEPSATVQPPPSLQSSQNLPISSTTPTDPWNNFDSAWSSLKGELTASDEDSANLLTLLQGLQTEAEGLRSSLELSIQQFEGSEAARLIEREAAEKRIVDAILRGVEAERQRDRARALAGILGGVAGILGAGLALSIIL